MDRNRYYKEIYYPANRERILAKSKERWPDYYSKNKEKRLLAAKNRRQIKKDELKEKDRIYRQQIKYKVLSHYCNGEPFCQCPSGLCFEKNIKFLTLDHINNDGAKQRKENSNLRSAIGLHLWLIRNNFPSGYRVLCWNCNSGRAFNSNVCPHEEEVKLAPAREDLVKK